MSLARHFNHLIAMTTDQLAALPLKEFFQVAARVFGEVLDRIPLDQQEPEWADMLLALYQRST